MIKAKQIFCCLAGLCLFNLPVSAQFSGQFNPLNITGTANVFKTEIPLDEPLTKGSNYLSEAWSSGTIVLKDGRAIGEYPIRVETEHVIVEIMVENKVHTIDIDRVQHILLPDAEVGARGKLVRGKRFVVDNKPLPGVVLVHDVNTNTQLLNNYFTTFIPSNYNVAMDVGSKDNVKQMKNRLFVQRTGSVTEIKGSNKKIMRLLDLDNAKARNAVDTNNLKLSDPKDLLKFLTIIDKNGK